MSMEFPGSLNRWDRYHIITQLAVYTTYIPLIYCLLGDYIREPETAIDHGPSSVGPSMA